VCPEAVKQPQRNERQRKNHARSAAAVEDGLDLVVRVHRQTQDPVGVLGEDRRLATAEVDLAEATDKTVAPQTNIFAESHPASYRF
jgi:hypothetical protein